MDEDGLTVYVSPEIEMYKGDQFKIVIDLSWKDGTNFGFQFMTEPGLVFVNEGGTGNIGIRRGKQGVYQFILHTDPFDYTNNYIEWELVREVEDKATEEMYIVGHLKASGYNSWSTEKEDMIAMTVGADGITWSVTIEIALIDSFKIYNALNESYHPNGTGNDLSLKSEKLPAGYYTITWNADTDAYTFTPAEAPEPDVPETPETSETPDVPKVPEAA